MYLHSLWNRPEKLVKGSLLYLFRKFVLIHFIFTDNIHILDRTWHCWFLFGKQQPLLAPISAMQWMVLQVFFHVQGTWDYQSSMQNYPLSLYVLVSNTTSGHPLVRGCTLQQRMHPCSGIIKNVDIQFKTWNPKKAIKRIAKIC